MLLADDSRWYDTYTNIITNLQKHIGGPFSSNPEEQKEKGEEKGFIKNVLNKFSIILKKLQGSKYLIILYLFDR
jgi:hypothetical protein